jgi:hypothetical protein
MYPEQPFRSGLRELVEHPGDERRVHRKRTDASESRRL